MRAAVAAAQAACGAKGPDSDHITTRFDERVNIHIGYVGGEPLSQGETPEQARSAVIGALVLERRVAKEHLADLRAALAQAEGDRETFRTAWLGEAEKRQRAEEERDSYKADKDAHQRDAINRGLEANALRSNVADLTASLKIAQESLRQREAAQRAAEQERDHWHQIVKDSSEGVECLSTCNSYGHDELCPLAHPGAAVREANRRLEAQTQAAYVAQEAQIAQGWKLHEAEEQVAALRAGYQRSKYESAPCPGCDYVDGVLPRLCVMHREWESEVAALRAALTRYGRHLDGCGYRNWLADSCTCGRDAARG